ncbi:rifin [Plasmodium sp. gorilla clade G1]|nr:PIR protein, putative [Plasmodium sp.]SOS76175.1 rifin [Plasmodium sp. gorilla clade G1]
MKLHYSKILLFSLSLNILARSKNKPYVTQHIPTTISRVLSECDIQTSIYDNDQDMKSVKDNFDRQTSQRFEEYNERIQDKRKKCKEQCDRDIEQIIVKDKVQKSIAEKVEKGCLKCGCVLGGGVAPVWGLVSGLWYAAWLNAAMAAAEKVGVDAGITAAINVLKETFNIKELSGLPLKTILNANNFKNTMFYVLNIQKEYNKVCIGQNANIDQLLCIVQDNQSAKYIAGNAQKIVAAATEKYTEITTAEVAKVTSAGSTYSTAIIASIVTIVVIVLVMIIVYLILRYQRKKKMKKKLQYTKLLNQ